MTAQDLLEWMESVVECYDCAFDRHDMCPTDCDHHSQPVSPPVDKPESLGDAYKGRLKGKEDLKDPYSTGRKRAAKVYPLHPSESCEWQGLQNCGGGARPIVGCIDGKQVARHHGPIKDPTQNQRGNVHRICTKCHNRWHLLNDLIYNAEENRLLPHDPVPAPPELLYTNEADWKNGVFNKKYDLAHGATLKKLREEEYDELAEE